MAGEEGQGIRNRNHWRLYTYLPTVQRTKGNLHGEGVTTGVTIASVTCDFLDHVICRVAEFEP